MSNRGTRINVEAKDKCFPKKAHVTDAAYDLFVSEKVELTPNSRKYIPLGFRIQLPSNMKLTIQPRSGQSGKGMIVHAEFPDWMGGGSVTSRVNADVILGLVDCGYGGEVKAIVKSGKWKLKLSIWQMIGVKYYLYPGDRICQGALTYVPDINLIEGSVNGTRDGLGSTDKIK